MSHGHNLGFRPRSACEEVHRDGNFIRRNQKETAFSAASLWNNPRSAAISSPRLQQLDRVIDPHASTSLGLYHTNTRLRMAFEKMAKCHKQFLRVFDTACRKRLLNIVDNHSADCFATMGLFKEIVS